MSRCLRFPCCTICLGFITGIVFLSPLAGASPLLAGPATEGYTYSLFNGKNLDGWTIENDCQASVQKGQIVLEAGNGWLRSHYPYADFRLHVEWKPEKSSDYDAGIYLRTLPGGKPFPKRGYQANLLQGKEGNIGNLKGAASSGLIKPGDWNTFDITVVGETVEMVINGKRAYKTGGLKIPVGFVGLQVEVPKGGRFFLRNIRITELGYRPLFNGKNLAGWEGAGQPAEKCWTVTNGELVCLKKGGPWLRSRQKFGDFNLRLEYLVGKNGNSGVYVRVPENGNHHRENATQPPAGFEIQILEEGYAKKRRLKPYQYGASLYDIAGASQHVGRAPGEWNTLEINCRGYHISVLHNGRLVVDVTPEKYPKIKLRQLRGYLGLQNHGGGVKFRKVRIGPPIARYGLTLAQ